MEGEDSELVRLEDEPSAPNQARSEVLPGCKKNSCVYHDCQGYFYFSERTTTNTRQLRCARKGRGCRARATMGLQEGAVIALSRSSPLHNHEPDLSIKESYKLRAVLKARSKMETTSLREIFFSEAKRLQNKQFKTEGPEVTDGSQQSRRSKKATSSDPDDAPPCKVPRLAKANETSGNVESTNRQQRRSSAVQYKESESEESVDCPGVEQTDYPLPAQVKAEPEYVAVAGQFEVVNLPSAGQLADEELFNNSVDAISTPQNQLCRLCVKNEGLVPLFQRSGAPRVLAIQAMTVTRVKVSSKDGLPARICRRCEDLLQQSFHFKLQCEVADVTLRSKVAARAVAPEVLSTAKADAFCLLTDQLDKTLTKLNCIVSSLKKLESKDRYSAPAPDRDTAPVGGVDVKVDAPSSPSGSGVEIKTEMEFEEHLSQSEPCIDSTSGSEEQTDGLLSSEELPPEKTEVPGTQPEMPVMQTSQEESGSSRLRERLQPSEPPSSAQLPGEHGTVRPGLQVKDVSSLRSALVGNPPNLSSAEVGGRIIPQLVKLGDGSVRLYHVYVPDPPPLPAPGDGQPGPLVPKGAARGRSKQLSRVQTLQAAQAAVQAAAQHTPTIVVQAPRGRGKNTVPTSTQIRAQKRKPWRVLTELISDPLQISESLRTQTLVHESSSPLIAQASAEASDPLRTQELTHESSPLIAQALAEASDPLRTQELTHEIDRLRMQASAQPCKLPDTHGLSKSSEPFVTKKLFEPSETHKEKPLEQTDELVKRDALTENEQCSTQDLVETVTVKFCEHTTDKIMS
ncbi:uncharacterized protein LOC134535104 isoform X6 [Bacillus rossius redtenbacheri]|uniref:uncharacterized protein LOC134535104 isoform X6 n=1 Tax=Bacillus rossius redtenbacheri TaxID=93214 RepID=UPI002FDDB02B